MRKSIVPVLAAALLAGSLGVSAHAKPRPASVNFYLRGPDCTAAVLGLSVKDEPGDGTCGGAENGAVNGVSGMAGQPYVDQVWMAYDGLPLVLDASSPVTGKLYITSWAGRTAGPATLDVKIDVRIGGKTVDAGTTTVDYLVTPASSWVEVAFEIDVPAKLQGKKVTALQMTTTSRGYAPLQGYFEMENPASFITIPALKG
ncbi:MAG: hypothetical protein ABR613_12355 [Actinomycetota bacterium]